MNKIVISVKLLLLAVIAVAAIAVVTGCDRNKNTSVESPNSQSTPPALEPTAEPPAPTPQESATAAPSEPAKTPTPTSNPADPNSIPVVSRPASITVMVNKHLALPSNYVPPDLVTLNVPFDSGANAERRKMRSEAAAALVKLFAGAKKEGIQLAGVSAYRSYKTQLALFNAYVKKDGLIKAKTYSAVPGTSEHQTGLAIDISGIDGSCAAEDCFAGTPEADWLAKHASEYGFIVRYEKGKESITGYQYEPWHIRYVGITMASEISAKGITLEEYMNAVPVSR